MNFTYVIGHRETSLSRKRNLEVVIEHFCKIPGCEIILVEQDSKSKASYLLERFEFKHVFLKNDGLFNRSWGFNVGYKQSNPKNNIIGFGDNDIILTMKSIEVILKQFETGLECINPYNTLYDLSETQTVDFINQMKLSNINLTNVKTRNGLNFTGGSVLFTKLAFEKVYYWDEECRGWGGEDDILTNKIGKFGIKTGICNTAAFHLNHDRGANDSRKQNNYGNNVRHMNKIKKMNKNELISYYENIIKTSGDILKYE